MRIGLNLPNYGELGTRSALSAIADAAEAAGYASLWTTDHILLPSRMPEPYGHLLESLTTLSFLSARTEHIGLGTSVLALPQRDPLLVAKQAATLQHLSGGRLTLGVGVGWLKEEFEYLRADFANRGRLANEYIAAIRELLTAPHPEFHGPTIEYANVIFSPRPERVIPIVVGGSSRGALSRAARLGDGWHGIHHSPDDIREIGAALKSRPLRDGFQISLRIGVYRDAAGGGVNTNSTLGGSPSDISRAAQAYEAAGVDLLVVEPATGSLESFLDHMQAIARALPLGGTRMTANRGPAHPTRPQPR